MELNSQGTLSSLELSEVGITDGLVQWYPLNGDANDYSGSGNHGTVYGPIVTSGLNGKLQYSFDGTDDYIHSQSCPLQSLTGDFSITIWIYCTNVTTDASWQRRICFMNDSSSSKFDLSMYEQGGITININGDPYRTPETSLINQWHFINFTKESTTYKIYIDGEDQTLSNSGINLNSVYSGLVIGIQYSSYFRAAFQGNIQDVRIYDRQLTQQEIKILYDLGLGSTKMITTESNLYISGILDEVTM